MIRVIFLFIILSAVISGVIYAAKRLSGEQVINLTRIGITAIISSLVAFALMFMLVELF